MMTEETYKKELVRMWDMKRCNDYKGKDICDDVFCEDCPLSEINNDKMNGCMDVKNVFEIIKIVERWSKENPPKKFKVSRMEYDILESVVKTISSGLYFFECDSLLMALLKKGYFEGATREMNVKDYFDNCEVE